MGGSWDCFLALPISLQLYTKIHYMMELKREHSPASRNWKKSNEHNLLKPLLDQMLLASGVFPISPNQFRYLVEFTLDM